YTYKNNSITNPILIDNNHPNAPFTLDIEAKTDRTRSAILYITVSDNGPLPQKHIFKLVLNFNTKVVTPNVDNPVFLPDTSRWYLRIVTGGNFDFFNGPTIKDFAGDISLFLPNTFNIGKVSFGFELGMNNYHYFNTDSSHTAPDNFKYFQHYHSYYSPTDTAKVILSSQNINRKYDYNVWGIHLNLLGLLLKN